MWWVATFLNLIRVIYFKNYKHFSHYKQKNYDAQIKIGRMTNVVGKWHIGALIISDQAVLIIENGLNQPLIMCTKTTNININHLHYGWKSSFFISLIFVLFSPVFSCFSLAKNVSKNRVFFPCFWRFNRQRKLPKSKPVWQSQLDWFLSLFFR
jgi:hypothetical protein